MDTRVRGELTKRLARIAGKRIRPRDLLDPEEVRLPPRVRTRTPDCARCTDRCCVHKERDSGILLSLRDIAHLVDSGLGHLVVGRFTFRRDRRGRILEDVDEMPRLAKQPDGNCHFYDEKTGRCDGYGFRPTICRRFPFEVGYRPGSGRPFARFIPWAKCPTVRAGRDAAPVLQMSRDAVQDENLAFEDTMLIPDALDELRRAGFGPYLPPPEECPGRARANGHAAVGAASRRSALAAVLAAVLAAAPAAAEWDVDGLEELLPRAESPLDFERYLARDTPPPPPLLRADPPPAEPIRNCAEWEPMTGAMIRYPLGLPYALLRDLDDHVTLHVVVSSSYLSAARTNLAGNGVDTSRVQWLVQPNNSIWTRDYGPWFVFDGGGTIAVVDHVYNRPARPDDDLIPVRFAEQQGMAVHRHDMWHTGGNYMTDGADWSMSTDLVYNEAAVANGMTPAQVDQLMHDYYGVEVYEVVADIESGGIHHIDTWAKFLDEETVLVKQVWTAHYTYAALEQRATLLASLPASTGRNYRVFRVYCHDIGGSRPAAYTNSTIVNGIVYVPAFGNATRDSNAVAAYRAAMPGYDVRAFYHSGWLTDDALHCRVMGIPDRLMLRVAHVPVRQETMGPVEITALVDDRSDAGLESVDLVWRFAGDAWTSTPMAPAGGDLRTAVLPAPPADTAVDYYVIARDLGGREAGMPRSAPAGWYTFPILANPQTAAPGVAAASAAGGARPNPFRDVTRFAFELRFPDRVRLAVHDVAGRVVRRLADAEMPGGRHEVVWDGRDDAGRRAAAGVYFFRLDAAGLRYSRAVVLAR